jgi:hypothetical protein
MPLSDSERKLRASIAGRTGWANTPDRGARAARGYRGLWQKFFDATDPALPDDVRATLADSAYKTHMKRLAFKSMKARRLRREAREKLAAERKAARQAEILTTEPAPSRHGTNTAYCHNGCRCGACTDAHAAYQREFHRARQAKQLDDGAA